MINKKKDIYSNAFVELNEIINHMDENIKIKIPVEIQKAIEKAGNKNYNFNYDNTHKLSEQDILPKTKSLLSIIYSDYLCSDEEKKKWDEYDKFERKIKKI